MKAGGVHGDDDDDGEAVKAGGVHGDDDDDDGEAVEDGVKFMERMMMTPRQWRMG
ncbi:MAG: hypothetical protein LBT40_14280 [Deltaproteobacteria bacterium]|nr:hypothetical protein [Deltaproteobacteria bacterium]